jgi:hypothetical protein
VFIALKEGRDREGRDRVVTEAALREIAWPGPVAEELDLQVQTGRND